jgi:hypothetical protein
MSMMRTLIIPVLLIALFLPNSLYAASVLGSIIRGTVTDQGDCTNMNGKLMAVYRTPTSEGIPFIFQNEKTRVMPRWVAPADGQTVLVLLGQKVVCTKTNGTSREERIAQYYSVSGAQRAAQEYRQGRTNQTGGGSASGATRPDVRALFPANTLPGTVSPYIIRTVPVYTSPGGVGSPFYQNGGPSTQQIIQDNDTSASDLIRGIAQ